MLERKQGYKRGFFLKKENFRREKLHVSLTSSGKRKTTLVKKTTIVKIQENF